MASSATMNLRRFAGTNAGGALQWIGDGDQQQQQQQQQQRLGARQPFEHSTGNSGRSTTNNKHNENHINENSSDNIGYLMPNVFPPLPQWQLPQVSNPAPAVASQRPRYLSTISTKSMSPGLSGGRTTVDDVPAVASSSHPPSQASFRGGQERKRQNIQTHTHGSVSSPDESDARPLANGPSRKGSRANEGFPFLGSQSLNNEGATIEKVSTIEKVATTDPGTFAPLFKPPPAVQPTNDNVRSTDTLGVIARALQDPKLADAAMLLLKTVDSGMLVAGTVPSTDLGGASAVGPAHVSQGLLPVMALPLSPPAMTPPRSPPPAGDACGTKRPLPPAPKTTLASTNKGNKICNNNGNDMDANPNLFPMPGLPKRPKLFSGQASTVSLSSNETDNEDEDEDPFSWEGLDFPEPIPLREDLDPRSNDSIALATPSPSFGPALGTKLDPTPLLMPPPSLERAVTPGAVVTATTSFVPPSPGDPGMAKKAICKRKAGAGASNLAFTKLSNKPNKSTSSKPTPPPPPPGSPQEYLNKILSERGYASQTVTATKAGYQTKPSPLQRASFGTELLRAVKTSDSKLLSSLLLCGLSRNPCNAFGDSVLNMVLKRGERKLFECLLNSGSSIHVADDFGRTPLHYAAWASKTDFDSVCLILDQEPMLVLVSDGRDVPPLQYVTSDKWIKWIEFLERHKNRFWPLGGSGDGFQIVPPKASSGSGGNGGEKFLPDPSDAVSIDLATMVSSGRISPREVGKMSLDERKTYKRRKKE